jgi:hypothetical protein
MEEYVSIHKIVSLIKQYQQSQVGIGLNSFGFGNIVEFGNTNNTGMTPTYPFVFVTPQNISYEENIVTYNMSLIFADRINDDLSNEVDVVSDMDIQARRFMSFIKRGMNQTPDLYDKMDIVLPTNAVPFQERFNDFVGGVALDCNFVVFTDINACDYYEPEPEPTPTNTPTNTNTPTVTPTSTLTPTPTPTQGAGTTQARTYLSAVVAAGGTVSAPMSAATINMFNSIWNNGLNTDMVAMYPFIGGTAASHSVQAMNPGTYSILFNGGWTHNTSGATPNGTTGYGILNGLVLGAIPGFTVSGGSVGVYCGTNGSSGVAIGSTNGSGFGAIQLSPGVNNPTLKVSSILWNSASPVYSVPTISDTLGLISTARSGTTTTIQLYRRGVLLSSELSNSSTLSFVATVIGANNTNGIINSYSTYRHQFTYVYRGTMSESQMSILNNIIQTYQTDLGRNVY